MLCVPEAKRASTPTVMWHNEDPCEAAARGSKYGLDLRFTVYRTSQSRKLLCFGKKVE